MKRNPVNRFIGERLADRRAALGLTLHQLAAQSGLEPDLLAAWEAGRARAPADALLLLAVALEVSVSDLMPQSPIDLQAGARRARL